MTSQFAIALATALVEYKHFVTLYEWVHYFEPVSYTHLTLPTILLV